MFGPRSCCAFVAVRSRSTTTHPPLSSSASLSDLRFAFEDDRNVPKLEEWAAHQGVRFAPGVGLVDLGLGDWGVGSSSSLDAQAPIVTVPAQLVLSSTDEPVDGYKEAIAKAMATASPGMEHYLPECLLVVRLLQEANKGEESLWKEWIDTLPPDFSTGLYLDPLERSVAERVAKPFLDHQEQQWKACKAAILEETDVDVDRLLWAFSVVFTRSWRPPPGDRATLVPLGDMFNHDSRANAKPNALEDGSFQLVAKNGIEPGSPLFLSYGFSTVPGRFLVNFGFWDRSADFMDANLTVPSEMANAIDASRLVVSTRSGAIAEDVFTLGVYNFLKQRDPEKAAKMAKDPAAYALAYDLEGALWLRVHALRQTSETYPDMDIAPENLSESPRRYGTIARYNNGTRESWLRVVDALEPEIEALIRQREKEEEKDQEMEEEEAEEKTA